MTFGFDMRACSVIGIRVASRRLDHELGVLEVRVVAADGALFSTDKRQCICPKDLSARALCCGCLDGADL